MSETTRLTASISTIGCGNGEHFETAHHAMSLVGYTAKRKCTTSPSTTT